MTLRSPSQAHWDSLRRDLTGELSLEEQDLRSHSEDASIFVIKPLAVVYPKTSHDIAAVLRFCREESISITARGAGTSRGGQPLGTGVILDFRRHWKSVLDWAPSSGELTVEPGIYYGEVQKFLQSHGRMFPPDPSWHQCSIGGMVANNAAGIHSVKYGGTIRHFRWAEFLDSAGGLHATSPDDSLWTPTRDFLRENRDLIESDFPKVEKNSAGYSLAHALDSPNPMASILCGSEGTLGIFTKIRIGTVPIPSHQELSIAWYPSMESALLAGLRLKGAGVAACELVDKVLLDLHSQHESGTGSRHARKMSENPWLQRFYDLGAEAVLIFESDGLSETEARQTHACAEEAARNGALDLARARSSAEQQAIWDLRRHTSPILNKVEDGKITIKPLWAVEDVCLPRENLVRYVREQDLIFREQGLICSFFGHVASANLHIDPLHMNLKQSDQAAFFDQVAEESYRLVVRLGGSISGEHGDGLLRTRYLPLQYPRSYPLFSRLKKLYDPIGLLNPGKIVP